ncbi:MAG TPA: hypothetical protein VH500_16500 [Nitrososphaeraceae archaeon]|jgi:hypothetical protein
MKLELLTNPTVVDDVIRFVSVGSKETDTTKAFKKEISKQKR